MNKKTSGVFLASLLALAFSSSCASSGSPDQLRFGVWASRNNLWDEAIFRWKKALQAAPRSAAAHNNLGVAYEKKGLFKEALEEYEAALKIEPGNTYVKSNYQNCKENIQSPAQDQEKKKAADEKNSLLLALILGGFAACLSEREVKISLDVPAPAALGPEAIPALRLAGFYQEKEVPEFDLSSVLTTYFRDELKPLLKGPVEIKPVAFESAGSLKSKDFWKAAAGEDRKSLILTGQAQFSQETRKALLEGERRDLDGPFKPQSPWSERKNFSLKLDLVIIDPASGEPLFQKEFQESITSENVKQPAEFAAYDLLQRIKLKLLRALFGSERSLQRYLLTK